MKPTTDRTWGIDRYKHSATFGELVVEVIYLWRTPGCKPSADNLTGVLAHDYEVTITKEKRRNGRLWCFVSADVEHEGKTYHQEGWISSTLLKDAGVKEFEGINK